MKEPALSVVNSRVCFESSWVNWTVAPATTAPVGSVTTPEICPVTLCALATGVSASSKARAHTTTRIDVMAPPETNEKYEARYEDPTREWSRQSTGGNDE